MDTYELDRRVTKAVESIISEIPISHNILTYAIEPDIDDRYSIPIFIEVNDNFALIHYFVDVIVSEGTTSIRFQFDSISFHNDEIYDEDDAMVIVKSLNTVLNTIFTGTEIYI